MGGSRDQTRETSTGVFPASFDTLIQNGTTDRHNVSGGCGVLRVETVASFTESRSRISRGNVESDSTETQFQKILVDRLGRSLGIAFVGSSPGAGVNLGRTLGTHDSFNNIVERSGSVEHEVPSLSLTAQGSDSLNVQIGFDTFTVTFFGTNNLSDGVDGHMVSLLERGQTGGTEGSVVEFNNTLSHLSIIGTVAGIFDIIIRDTEIFDHGIDSLLSDGWLPSLLGIERTLVGVAGLMDGNIGDTIDTINILFQLRREAQQIHIVTHIHQNVVSQDQMA
mmetsp:Transcript_16122/g.18079  ORF Transcript_16122/g.18079 Transcript_16122/m.18079 type:complete len:279 (-) Transcript_16122:468-1304(-)